MKTAGMILAAGRGTRMGPISDYLPKPLLPVAGVPLISVVAAKLSRAGAGEIHANIHHRPDMIERFVAEQRLDLILHREKELLDTGGGIGNMAASGIDADIVLLHNGDIISVIEYGPAIDFHLENGALLTMILVPSRGHESGSAPPPHVIVAEDASILGFDVSAGSGGMGRYGYTGMSVLSRECLGLFPAGAEYGLTSFISGLIKARPGSVKGFVEGAADPADRARRAAWADTGTPSAYLMLHQRIIVGRELFDPLLEPPPGPVITGKGAVIDPDATCTGFVCVGHNAVIKEDTVLEDCVVLDGTIVPAGTSARNAIIFPGGTIKGDA